MQFVPFRPGFAELDWQGYTYPLNSVDICRLLFIIYQYILLSYYLAHIIRLNPRSIDDLNFEFKVLDVMFR